MSTVSPSASIGKRTFASAVSHLLETAYRLLGGRRILALLAEAVEKLIQEFYPDTQPAASGTLVWSGTAAEGQKAQPGKRTEDYQTVTVLLPLGTAADVQAQSERRPAQDSVRATAEARQQAHLVRIVKAAAQQGGLLTLVELRLILNRPYDAVRDSARAGEDTHDELRPFKGLKLDQGSRPTHKGQITRLYEQGREPPDIARETEHSLTSVERYLKDYERVKLLLRDCRSADEISQLINRGKRVVLEYIEIAQKFHPELFAAEIT